MAYDQVSPQLHGFNPIDLPPVLICLFDSNEVYIIHHRHRSHIKHNQC